MTDTPAVWVVPTGVVSLLWLDAPALDARGSGPGPPSPRPRAVLAAQGLRCAAAWREGTHWRTTRAAVSRPVPRQALAPALLAGATGAAAVLLIMAPVVLLVVLGPPAFAATVADLRRPASL
ncbi:hypothetical protein ACFYWX_38205 [Streptomyces sp. NPDC002888]|uniref:hypothetical protein n=1 Tax=Streptomyces sp. NPDC002888 TaxID=3364668 RepID=UPI0036B5C8F2